MAGDTRDSSSPPIRPLSNTPSSSPATSSSLPKTYETFTPPPNANSLPEGAGRNTAGGHVEAPTLSEAVKTVRFQDFKQVYMYPCARDSLMIGIGGAFGAGGLRLILGAPIFKACNWAVGTFCFAGIASYEFCQQRRRLEKINMKRAVEIVERKKFKKAEEEAQMRKAVEERRKTKEEADRQAEMVKRRSWKFW